MPQDSQYTVRQATRDLMRELGLRTVFGNPGSTELGFLADWPDEFRYVLGLQEAAVIAMADGYTQYSGNAAVVNLHSAGGLGHGLGSLVTAYRNRAPVIVIAGQQARPLLGGDPFLGAIDAANFPRPYVKWACEPARALDVPAALARAYQVATQRPYGPVYLSVPGDDWDVEFDGQPVAVRPRTRTRNPLAADDLAEIVDALDASARPALVYGAEVDAAGAVGQGVELAERTGAAVWASPMSRRCSFPEDHPQFAGFLIPSQQRVAEALAEYDLVVVIGAPAFTYHVHAPDHGPKLPPIYLLNDDENTLAWAPEGIGVRATPAEALTQLADGVRPADRPAPKRIERPAVPAASNPIHAGYLMDAVSRVLPENAVLVEEAPSNRRELHEYLPIRSWDGGFLTMASGVLGYGLPAAIGVAMAQPSRRVVALIGDGSSMYAIQGLWTAARHRVPVTWVILDNGQYGALVSHAGGVGVSKSPGNELGGLDFVGLAASMGVTGRYVEEPGDLEPALAGAIASDEPILLHVKVARATEYPY